jgi:hypothetical protein
MTQEKGGFFISFEPARRKLLLDAAKERDKFSVDLSIADWAVGTKEMFLVSLSESTDTTDFAAIGRRKAGPHNTGGYNIEFTSFVDLGALHLPQLLGRLSPKTRATIKEREGARGKYFPPQTWGELLTLVKDARAASATNIDMLWARVVARDPLEREIRIQKLAMQREVLGLSLDIAGLSEIRREEFRKAQPIGNAAADVKYFIDLMDSRTVHERTLMEQDRSFIERAMSGHPHRTASFSAGQRNLRVWIVDKEPIEELQALTASSSISSMAAFCWCNISAWRRKMMARRSIGDIGPTINLTIRLC